MAGLRLIELRVGSVLAGYRVEGVVARGGMGLVYEARELASDRVVALKVLLPELSGDVVFRERFERESRIAMSLEHPHVVPVYATGEAQGVVYIAMRFVHGVDLRHLTRDVGPLPPQRAVAIAEQVASGLDAAHSLGLVHRDVKPANVIVESLGDHDHCYVMDFGLAKQAGSTSFTHTGNWVGTLDFAAPEQILASEVDARTDVYALGALLFAVLTGRPPFPAEHDAAKLHAHLHSPPPSVTSARPGLAPQFDAVIARALAKAPEDRYPSAGDLGRAARAALTGGPTAPERSVATGEAATLALVPRPRPVSAMPTQIPVVPPPHLVSTPPPQVDATSATRRDFLARTRGKRRRLWPVLAPIAVVLALAGAIAAVILTSGRSPKQPVARQAAVQHPTRKPQPRPAAANPAAVIKQHFEDIHSGNYQAAFEIMTARYRAQNPAWASDHQAAGSGINVISVGAPQYGSGDAQVPVDIYARDRHATPGSDTKCREFTGTAHMVQESGDWRYDPSTSSLNDTVVPSTNPNCPSSTPPTTTTNSPTTTITPQRATLATFAGTWYGHTRSLRITRTGLATESIGAGCCNHAITFTMRLSDPSGTTSVGSVLTRVVAVLEVNPADFNRASPTPEVGQTGQMTLRHGVIVDPFLHADYCDMAADKAAADKKALPPCGA